MPEKLSCQLTAFDTVKDAMDTTAGRQVSQTIAREVTRGLMGILGGK